MALLVIVAAYAGTALLAAVIFNILSQLLFHDKNKPPVVFHWIPFLGSTITYGLDPYAFFFSCREKVSSASTSRMQANSRSMATSSPSSFWAKRPPYT